MNPIGFYTSRQKCGHYLKLTLPGLDLPFTVQFPNGRLPVCVRCKKNYKSRELCRSRDLHKDHPWTTTYICITLDHTCTDSNNNLIDGPFVAHAVDKQLFCFKNNVSKTMPVCATCKGKNYIRSYCRTKLGHKHLPWGTVYAVLSAANSNGQHSDGAGKPSRSGLPEVPQKKTVAEKAKDGDDIHRVHPSRTFLVNVSSKSCKINWLDYDDHCPRTPCVQQDRSRLNNYPPRRHLSPMQEQNTMVQNVAQQMPNGYCQPTGHWVVQQHPQAYDQMNFWNHQGASVYHHGGNFPVSHANQHAANQGQYHQKTFDAERIYPNQQVVQQQHPTIRRQTRGSYHHGEMESQSGVSSQSMGGHVHKRTYDSIQFQDEGQKKRLCVRSSSDQPVNSEAYQNEFFNGGFRGEQNDWNYSFTTNINNTKESFY